MSRLMRHSSDDVMVNKANRADHNVAVSVDIFGTYGRGPSQRYAANGSMHAEIQLPFEFIFVGLLTLNLVYKGLTSVFLRP